MATDRQNLYAEKTLIQNTHLLALKGENPLFLHTPQFPGEGAAVYTQIVGQFAPPHVQMEFAAGLDRARQSWYHDKNGCAPTGSQADVWLFFRRARSGEERTCCFGN